MMVHVDSIKHLICLSLCDKNLTFGHNCLTVEIHTLYLAYLLYKWNLFKRQVQLPCDLDHGFYTNNSRFGLCCRSAQQRSRRSPKHCKRNSVTLWFPSVTNYSFWSISLSVYLSVSHSGRKKTLTSAISFES